MATTSLRLSALLLGLSVAACSAPPPDTRAGRNSPAYELGQNAAGETCTVQRNGAGADIYCGSAIQPSGHVAIPAQAQDPATALTTSAWREAFDRRFLCAQPSPAKVQDAAAMAMRCNWRQRGFPQSVLASQIDGTLYIADAVGPAEAVLPRAIGVLANKLPQVEARKDENQGLQAQRLADAAQSGKLTGADAIAAVDQLTSLGARENRAGRYAAAEAAYHASRAIQERLVGGDHPALAVPLAREALQISNQERFHESAPLFARAVRLAALPNQTDPAAAPMVAHLQALDELNRGKPADALAHLKRAEQGYLAFIPKEALVPARTAVSTGNSAVERMAERAATAAVFSDQTTRDAVNGLIETRRYQAVALRALGRLDEAEQALTAERALYNGRDPRLVARYYRTLGMTSFASSSGKQGTSELNRAVDIFTKAQPESRPLAETQLLRATQLIAAEEQSAASALCQQAIATLRTSKSGVSSSLLLPCLRTYAIEAERRPGNAQAVLAEMFAVSQFAQGNVTGQQIALATARLAEGARDPRVKEAIRQRDSTKDRLEILLRRQSDLASSKDTAGDAAAMEPEVAKARAAANDADQEVQSASPGFAALVQETVPAQSVLSALRPDEALIAIVLGEDEGWTFLLRDGKLSLGRIDVGAKVINPLVARFRKTTEVPDVGAVLPFDIASAQALYDAVLRPVASGLDGAKTLIVAPAGSLLSVPFSALLTGPAQQGALSNAPFLVRQMAITHVPSPASFVNLRKAAKTVRSNQPWFGFGDFRPPSMAQALATFPVDLCGTSAYGLSHLPPLSGASVELTVARRLLNGSASSELLGPNFTAARVMAATLKDYRVLHFATHAVLPGELRCLSEPAILTSTTAGAPNASGAFLKASQVQQMDLDAELVILSACNTGGANTSGAGEGLSGLARSFLFAGARSLLVTHWSANDKSMTYLTALFLRNQTGATAMPLPEALATAQRQMLDEAVGSTAELGHPHYWAVGALVGGMGAQDRATAKVAAIDAAVARN